MAAEMRVILVGKTGIDAQLRRDRSIEVVSATTPMEAIGHLSQRNLGQSGPSVVLVGTDVDAELSNPTAGTGSPSRHTPLERFITGLRTVEPAVRVVRITNNDSAASVRQVTPSDDAATPAPATKRAGTSASATFDASLPSNADMATLERAIRGTDARETEQPTLDHQVARLNAAAPVGDHMLVTELARGKSITDLAMATITARMGTQVRLIAVGQGPIVGPSAVVEHEGHVFGHLTAQADPQSLAPHASWLAGWLQLQDMQAKLRRAAFTDPLTGAWNRRYFERFLGAAINNARAKRLHVTVLLFDIDDFKRYNDEFGHDAGDEILVEAVRLMRSVIRPTDRVCRIGGDEFAVIFHDPQGPRVQGSSNSVSVVELANRFKRQIVEHRFPKLTTMARGTLTISGGMAAFPWDGTCPAELLTRADELARESKVSGKNAITFGPGAIKAGLNTPI